MNPNSPLSAFARGKAPMTEDVLTGLIFGRLHRLSGAIPGLLSRARDLRGCAPPTVRSLEHLAFWPWWGELRGLPGCEPDVEVMLRDASGTRWLFAIEAKLGAQKSGDDDDTDQLMRQVGQGAARGRALGARFGGVIYLTAHYASPRAALSDSELRVQAHPAVRQAAVYWCSWTSTAEQLVESAVRLEPIDEELLTVLRQLGHGGFAGWRRHYARPDWRFEAPWRAPLSPGWRWVATTDSPHPPGWSYS